MSSKRTKGGAGFAKRQTAAAEARRAKEQRRSLYGAIAGIAVVILLFTLWQVLRPASQGDASGAATTGSALTGDRPLADLAPAQRNDYYSAYPEMVIDTDKRYEAVISTAKGDVRIELFDDAAPLTVNNFVFLANEGFYDGLTFHRVLADFMAQGGDPTGRGAGGPGYRFEDEIDSSVTFDRAGLLAMANSGPGTNGSQFFITYAPTPWLNGNHTIFGQVIEGTDVLAELTLRDPEQSPTFTGDVMERVDIVVYEQ